MASFNEIAQAAFDGRDVIICSVSSGLSVAYENAEFMGDAKNGNLKFKTQGGKRFQVKDIFGDAALVGKANTARNFIALADGRVENDNYFQSVIL